MPPSSTVTGANQPATRNDHTHTSPGNPTPHTGTPYCEAPQPFAPTARLEAGSPAQGPAEHGIPNRPPPGLEPFPASHQEGSVEGDCGSPKFVQDDSVSDLERRKVDTVSNQVTEITKDQREDAATKLISELRAQFNDGFREQLASLRIELQAGLKAELKAELSNENFRAALQAEIEKAVKTAIEENVTEPLRSMPVTMTQLSETVDIIREDLQDLKNAFGLVEPVSGGVVEDLEGSVRDAQPQFGRISHEDSADLVREVLGIISSTAILGPTMDTGTSVAQSGVVPDIPTTPTAAPDTPSDRPSSLAEVQACHFLKALHALARFYESIAFKKRT